MLKNIWVLWLVGLILWLTQAVAQPLNYAALDNIILQQMQRYQAPGLGVALLLNGKVVMAKGYGVRDLASQKPVTPNTLFSVASVTKSFTSLAVMQQVASGRLDLDVPVRQYLPQLQFSNNHLGQKITLRHLLANSSGLSREDGWLFDHNLNSRQQLLAGIAQIPINQEAGRAFQYSNQNYLLAAAVLEQSSGQSWEDFVQERILAPLQMKESYLLYNQALSTGRLATPYSLAPNGVQPISNYQQFASDDRWSMMAPAGGILASINDLATYALFHLNAQPALISRSLLQESHRPQVAVGYAHDPLRANFLDDVRGYGLGWYIGEYRGIKGFGHGGNFPGYTSMVYLLPQQALGIVLLTNLNAANDFLDTTRLMLLEEMLDMQPRSDFSQSPVLAQTRLLMGAQSFRPDPTVLQQLIGRYVLVGGGFIELSMENNSLMLSQGGLPIPLTPLSQQWYWAQSLGLFLEAQFDPSGMVWLRQDGQLVAAKMGVVPGP